jgi:hypothetical protein
MENKSKAKVVCVPRIKVPEALVFDTSTFEQTEGKSLRDAWYRIKELHNVKTNPCSEARLHEALAMQFGLQMVENMGCSPVTAESDCLELINAYTGVTELWSPYTDILADCFQIASRIGQIKFQHSRRETNKAALNLAKLCFETDSSLSWDGDPPPSVLIDVLNDLSDLDQ